MSERESILQEAQRLVGGDRQSAYGHPSEHFRAVATMWSVLIGAPVKPEHVPLCMAALKLVRESHVHRRDNLTDCAGYMATLAMLVEES